MSSMSLHVDFGVFTHTGRVRARNEDSVDIAPDEHPAGRLFIVADGAGGENYGDVASQHAVRRVRQMYYAYAERYPNSTAEDVLRAILPQVNQEIYDIADERDSAGHMGTTIVVAVLRQDHLTVAWAGDSRAYVISYKKRAIRQITVDHTEIFDQVRARLMTPQEAHNHPRRNVLSRSLGGSPDVEIEVIGGKLESGDAVLLCSDGLTRYIKDREICHYALNHSNPKEAAGQLGNLANERGGKDNITAVVIYIGERPDLADTLIQQPAAVTIRRPQAAFSPYILIGVSVSIVVALGIVILLLMTLQPSPDSSMTIMGTTETSATITTEATVTQTAVIPTLTEPPTTVALTPSQTPTPTAALTLTATRSPSANQTGGFIIGQELRVVEQAGVYESVGASVPTFNCAAGETVRIVRNDMGEYQHPSTDSPTHLHVQCAQGPGWVEIAALATIPPTSATPTIPVADDPLASAQGQVSGNQPGHTPTSATTATPPLHNVDCRLNGVPAVAASAADQSIPVWRDPNDLTRPEMIPDNAHVFTAGEQREAPDGSIICSIYAEGIGVVFIDRESLFPLNN